MVEYLDTQSFRAAEDARNAAWEELRAKFPEVRLPHPGCWQGWFPIIERLLSDLRAALPDRFPELQIDQVKEKLAGLRVYADVPDAPDEARGAITLAVFAAESRAARTCEMCGKPGLCRARGGWLSTRCDEHAAPNSVVTPEAERQRAWRPEMHVYGKGQPPEVWRFDYALDAAVKAPD